MTVSAGCAVKDCGRPAVCALESGAYCRGHFIAACYEQLDAYARQMQERRLRDSTADALRQFLTECTRQAAEFAESAGDLDNLERARLLDILQRAADLSHHLRRSPRRAAALAVRLRCDKLGHSWEEDARTRMLSRYGVLMECQHAVESGEVLTFEWPEKSKQARARVAWVHPADNGTSLVGVEFLDAENFWELDWNRPL